MDKDLFFYELEGRGYTFQNKKWDETKHGFEDDMLNMAWEMWSSAKHSIKAQAVPEGFVLVKDEPVAYMVQNKFWKGEFEVKLLSEMPEPEFDGDSYDVEIPLYMIEAQELAND